MLYLDVRGENDDRGLGDFFANHPSRVEPFRCAARRHPDVHDRELGPMLSDERDQLGRVAALADLCVYGAEVVMSVLAGQGRLVEVAAGGGAEPVVRLPGG